MPDIKLLTWAVGNVGSSGEDVKRPGTGVGVGLSLLFRAVIFAPAVT